MANRICIQRCEFINYPNRDVTYGFRAYDDYGQTYLNTLSAEQMTIKPLEFLKWLIANIDDACLLEMLDSTTAVQSGLCLDDGWYEWNEIRPILLPDPVAIERAPEQ